MLEELAEKWLGQMGSGSYLPVEINQVRAYLQYCPPLLADAENFKLYVLKYDEALDREILFQASDLIQLYSHIYNRNLGRQVTSELVKAIVDNDPLKMKRLSAISPLAVQQGLTLYVPRPFSEQNWLP